MKFVKTAVLAVSMLCVAQGVVSAQTYSPKDATEAAQVAAAGQPKYAFSDSRAIGVGLIIIGAAMGKTPTGPAPGPGKVRSTQSLAAVSAGAPPTQ